MAEKLFSEREGLIPEKSIQIKSIDEESKIQLWNKIYDHLFSKKLLIIFSFL